MKYLEDYNNKQEANKRNFIKQFIINRLDSFWIKEGQESQKALYFNRVLRATKTDIDNTKVSILEIGGGNGDFMAYKHKNIIRRVMVDVDDYYKNKFTKDGIEFYCQDISKEKLNQVQDNSIDIIMLNHLIEHIDDVFFFMKELVRVMKTGARIYIRTPDIEKVGFSFYSDFTHIKPFTKAGLQHMMATFGFKEELLVHSDNSTMRLEEFFNLKLGVLSFLNAKEIEAVFLLK